MFKVSYNKLSCNAVRDIKSFLIIIGASLSGLILLLANPGYFSHDELQKYDHVLRYGFDHYISMYVKLQQTSAFGSPVRPFSFFVQGVLALFMDEYPVLVHLFAVMTHALVGCLLYVVANRFLKNKSLSLTIAIIFVLNPLAVLATGWSAALMDRFYILFGLITLLCAEKFIRQNASVFSLAWICFWSTMSILSKETAMILPGLLLLIVASDLSSVKSKRFWYAGVAWSIPILLFMLYRLPSILASFGAPSVTDYKASITNVPDGLMVYIAYPFIYSLTEANNWVFISSLAMWGGVFIHLLVVYFVGVKVGGRASIIYVLMYLLFLVPVLLIPIKGAHYMYGSSLVLSAGLGVVLFGKADKFYINKFFGGVAVLVLLAHAAVLQNFVYTQGGCMNKAMISTEAMYQANGRPAAVDFQAEPGAPNYVLMKINTGREQIGSWYPVKLTVSNWGDNSPDGALSLAMTAQCLVYKK
jgi:hypothetical protein